MARLRQQHPQNYVNSGNIHTDFENVIRYINAAELGDKTVGELFAILFNEEGVFRGPVQMRVDSTNGLQFRVGMYAGEDEGWQDLVSLTDLRGPSGSNAGVVEGPFFYNRQDFNITTGVDVITVVGGGTLYTAGDNPTVAFSAPEDSDGSVPTAVATVDANTGQVVSIAVSTPGSGYLNAPTITISNPINAGGTAATATCTLATVPASAAIISYNFDADTDDVVVFKNGLLLAELTNAGTSEYATNTVLNQITIDSSIGAGLADKFTIYSVRSQSVTNFRRQDTDITGATSTVPFVHTAEEKILVWRNGILQEEGGAADYLANPNSNTITFLDAGGLVVGDKISVLTVENQALKTVGGLMFEEEYTDASGFIKWAKIAVLDDEIPQSKVSNLSGSLATKANIKSQSTSPSSPLTGDLWLDTSLAPSILKFYDGTQWLETSPESSLPTFVQTNANQYVRVNGTGTALEYGDIDFSALVPKTYMGAANGVATLDTGGKMPVSQLPETFSTTTIDFFSVHEDSAAAIGNKTYFISRLFKQTIRIDGIAYKLNSGSCTIQLSVDGVPVGNTYAVTTTEQSENLATVIEIDSTANSKRLELVVTNNTGGQSLEVAIAAATVNV
jgi:hypothetical protein